MKLEHPFLQLPVLFDAQVLAREIDALGESVWRPHPQGFAGNTALPLISVGGDPRSDAVRGPMRPTPQLLACPYLMEVMHALGAVWGRSRLMRLAGQAEVTPHVDINYYWREHLRIHVPIVTQPTVRFVCDGEQINMAAGECWTFDTWRLHRVHNDDARSRIHLVADTVGGPGFWKLMRDARPHDARDQPWRPRRVTPGSGPVELEYENVNVPLVMSPWEVRDHVRFLLGEAARPEDVARISCDVFVQFERDWQALWARHGDSGRGLQDYRALRDRLRGDVAPYEAIRLRNNVPLVKALHGIVTANLVASDAAPVSRGGPSAAPVVAPASAARAAVSAPGRPPLANGVRFSFTPSQPARPLIGAATGAQTPVGIERPVILLSAPRSGSTLLFETLARATDAFTIGHESHRTIESIPGLHPSARGFDSNRLLAGDATPEVIAALRRNFGAGLRDRHGNAPVIGASVRLLEKTPKNTLRVPFLRSVFPDARFVYLYRDPRPVIASMIEAWQSGRFRTYPNLPGWSGLPWSLLLVPGWRSLIGRPIEEVVAAQWAATTSLVLDDLERLPPDVIDVVRYDDLTVSPAAQVARLCKAAALKVVAPADELPLSRHTLSPPDPEKWRRYEHEIERLWPLLAPVHDRAERFVAAGLSSFA